MSFISKIYEKARKEIKTIVLSEGFDERVLQAALKADELGLAKIVLLGDKRAIEDRTAKASYDSIKVINPLDLSGEEDYAERLTEIRKDKGLSIEGAKELLRNPLYYGAMMVQAGDADGMVTGAATSSSDVLRAALQVIKCKPGVPIISSCVILDLSDNPYLYKGFMDSPGSPYLNKVTMDSPGNSSLNTGIWVLADCVVNINPTAHELAIIAVSSAETMKTVLEIEPKVAMLSFSTKGSAKHDFVDKVASAVSIARNLDPALRIEGEMQLDAAIIKSVGQMKFPGSDIAGEANVLIFPDIQAGNIGYKLVERVGGARFISCVVQGLNRPMNDLSRGCNSDDIVNSIAITAIQAQKR